MADPQAQLAALRRGVVDLHTDEDLLKKLARGRPLRVKLGVDPTAPDLHLGHTVILNKLRAFQDLGHAAVLILGDFTARVGDPSGRDRTRPMLTDKEIDANARTFWEQAAKILKPERTDDLSSADPSKTIVVMNSAWLAPFVRELLSGGTTELFKVLSQMTVSRLLEREDFKARFDSGHPITMLEFLYPVFQGYDSVAVRADVELGGTDQLFNLLVGRDLQRRYYGEMGWREDEPPQVALTMPLLVGTDGRRKMSKSYGNHIGLQDEPSDIFGKTMSLDDATMMQYYELLTTEELDAVKSLHPMEAKKRLAASLADRFHGAGQGAQARERFEKQFSRREVPEDTPAFQPRSEMTLVETLVASGLAPSKNEARRLIEQGAVRIDDRKIVENVKVAPLVRDGSILKVGSRRLVKLLVPGS